MKEYIDKSAVVAEIEKLKGQLLRGACSSQISMETYCKEEAYDEVLSFLDTLEVKEVDTLISDSRKANRAKFIKELKQKIDSYERELSKSGDSTKCDDVDWVTLASDMFDMLQKCLMNY